MSRTVYSHPDGFTLAFNDDALTATDDDGKTVSLPIGPLGLVELGNALLALAAERGAGYVAMHNSGGADKTDTAFPDGVVAAVRSFFEKALAAAARAGLGPQRLCFDPGIGFGKTVEHNLDLLNQLDWIRERCQAPLLVGTSRKRFIGAVLDRPTEERLMGTAASVAAAIARGADIVRVHDVPEMVRVCRMADAIVRQK